jgi:hypothetical protein
MRALYTMVLVCMVLLFLGYWFLVSFAWSAALAYRIAPHKEAV